MASTRAGILSQASEGYAEVKANPPVLSGPCFRAVPNPEKCALSVAETLAGQASGGVTHSAHEYIGGPHQSG